MSLIFNETEIETVICDGVEIENLVYNGIEVFCSVQPLVPTLTAHNSSIIHNFTYYPYQAFDGNDATTTTDFDMRQSDSTKHHTNYLGYVFSTAKSVKYITVRGGLDVSYGTYLWTCKAKLQYSDNGSTWYDASGTITVRNGITDTLKSTVSSKHKYWRLYFNSCNNYSSDNVRYAITISSLQFYGN